MKATIIFEEVTVKRIEVEIETDMTNEQLDEFENTEIEGTTNDYLNDYVSDKILNTNKTFEETTTNVIGVDWS